MNLIDYRKIWESKPVTRYIYEDYYRKIISKCISGKILEVGGGSGNLKRYLKDVISIDVQTAQWLDLTADAQYLPFSSYSFNNIVMIDVLHHIESPALFFSEACRVLKCDGRIIMLEPAITPFSWIFYNYIHEEPVDLTDNPMTIKPKYEMRDPFDSNQAIPTLLFDKYRGQFSQRYPDIDIVDEEYMSLFAYPLSGGFKEWCLLPMFSVSTLLALEEQLLPYLGKYMAFRMLVTLRKKSNYDMQKL